MLKILMRLKTFSALALLSTGCVSLLPDSGDLPPRLALDAGPPLTGDVTPRYNRTLVVDDPDAPALYNTTLVAVATSPSEYEYLADAEWTDRVPVLVRRYLTLRFENEGLFQGVGSRTDLLAPDYVLQTDIRAFRIDGVQRGAMGSVVLAARLLDRRGDVLATRIFQAQASPTGDDRRARVKSLNDAIETVSNDMIAWVDGLVAEAGAES